MPTTPEIPDCTPDLLRGLFLFESLSEDRLDYLCRNGSVISVEPGWLYRQGEDATCFYVLLEGSLVMSRKVGDDEVEVNRTSMRGSYVGAWNAYLGDLVPQVYDQSVRVTEPATFFQLDAVVLREVMQEWFPMAQHLLAGLFQGFTNRQRTVAQRERLLALGSPSAGADARVALGGADARAQHPRRGRRTRHADPAAAGLQDAGEAGGTGGRAPRRGRPADPDQ